MLYKICCAEFKFTRQIVLKHVMLVILVSSLSLDKAANDPQLLPITGVMKKAFKMEAIDPRVETKRV